MPIRHRNKTLYDTNDIGIIINRFLIASFKIYQKLSPNSCINQAGYDELVKEQLEDDKKQAKEEKRLW